MSGGAKDSSVPHDAEVSAATSDHGSPEPDSNDDGHRQTFVGETSMQALGQAKAQLDNLAAQYVGISPLSSGRPLTPRVHDTEKHDLHVDARKRSKSWLREVLSSYGIVLESLDCRTLLQVFFDDVHVLYPFLHRSSVWQTYDYLWKHSLLVSPRELETGGESRLSIALLFVCLALGRCTASSRIGNIDGAQSAGWSLYSVAMDLVPSLRDITSDAAMSLQGLQILALMVSATDPRL